VEVRTGKAARVKKAKPVLDCLASAARAGDAWAACEFATRLREAGDFERATRYYAKAADAGNVEGMVQYAWALRTGKGVAKDPQEAARWYRKAANAGDSRAMYHYANALISGEGVRAKDTNIAEGARYMKQSADKGFGQAEQRYGVALEKGEWGLEQSVSEAVKYYQKSSDHGNPGGMYFYANLLEHGTYVAQDPDEAKKLYRLAAAAGAVEAMADLGWMLIQEGEAAGIREGIHYLDEAAKQHCAAAHYHLGEVYADGLAGETSPEKAFACYKKAADKNHGQARLTVAQMMAAGKGTKKDGPGALEIFEDLIENSEEQEPDALVGAAKLLVHGADGVPKDQKRAKQYLLRAREKNPRAESILKAFKWA
jgi:TPR repeat protein